MSANTSIEWTNVTWNPVRGCSRISPGCVNCYAERIAARFSRPGLAFEGFADAGRAGSKWTGKLELVEDALDAPLRWRKPRRIFVNSMSDLFHESLPDDAIENVFAVMAFAPWHTFQVLTKRAERMRAWFGRRDTARRMDAAMERVMASVPVRLSPGAFKCIQQRDAIEGWPLPNVWLGVSVEDQQRADERVPLLLQTPAAVRFVSYEPALGPVDFTEIELPDEWAERARMHTARVNALADMDDEHFYNVHAKLDWIIAGGESGPGARPCDLAWIRSVVAQCRAADVPCFVKQTGSNAVAYSETMGHHVAWSDMIEIAGAKDPKGGDPKNWPPDIRVREFPRDASAEHGGTR